MPIIILPLPLFKTLQIVLLLLPVPGASSSSVQSLYPADVSEVSKPTNAVLVVKENRDNVNLSAELVVVKRPLRVALYGILLIIFILVELRESRKTLPDLFFSS